MEKIEYWNVEKLLESEKYPFTQGQFRGLLLKRKENGLNECIRKIGKRLYIRIDLFDMWIEKFMEVK